MSWPRALDWIRRIEGGYVNHPSDPGGATYAGVSLRAVVKLDRDSNGKLDFDLDGDGDVDDADIRQLHARPDLVEQFYLSEYFEPVGAPQCPWPMAIRAFDAAVHHGPGAAVLMIQRSCRIPADGLLGPRTRAAMKVLAPEVLVRFDLERLDLFHRLAVARARKRARAGQEDQADPFYRGWAKRILWLQREATAA